MLGKESKNMCANFSKQGIFPVIGEIIDSELLICESINRDEIARKLLEHPKTKEVVAESARKTKTNNLLNISGNMVDWFSAEITKRSTVAAPWLNKYHRIKTKVDSRKIWNYKLNHDENFIKKNQALIAAKEEAKKKNILKPEGNQRPIATQSLVTQYQRDAAVIIWVLQQANGKCESCEKPAPFNRSDGQPFLEVHHVRQLAYNGSDTVTNAVALCPNCHREFHHGENSKTLILQIYERVARLVRE